jgi:hypothetical protein
MSGYLLDGCDYFVGERLDTSNKAAVVKAAFVCSEGIYACALLVEPSVDACTVE